MSEAPAETAGPTEAAPVEPAATTVRETQPQEGTQQQETFDKEYVQQLRRENAAARKALAAKDAEVDKFRKATMSETEKAIAEAEDRGRRAATVEFGRDRARSRFDTLAAKRNPEADTDPIVEFLDLTKFVSDDGEVNDKALQAAVEKLVPEPNRNKHVDFDGGSRESGGTVNMDTLIRQKANKG